MLNFENLDKFIFDGVGKYNIPQIQPVFDEPLGDFIPMNYAKTTKDQANKILHCFVDDYQFVRYWNQPDTYIPMLSKFKAVCSPDFSTYTDMPLAMQEVRIYYRDIGLLDDIPEAEKEEPVLTKKSSEEVA